MLTPYRPLRGSISFIRQRPSETRTSGGRSETDRKPLAVMPWTTSRSTVVTTVTPVANRPMTWRNSRAAFSTARALGVSRATPVWGRRFGFFVGVWPGAAAPAGRGGGIRPAPSVGRTTRVSRATPSRSVTWLTIAVVVSSGSAAPDGGALGAGAGLVGVVKREPDDPGGDPLLEPVELADLDLGADLGVLNGITGQRDRALERRAPRAARHHADFSPAHVHGVAV